MSGRGCCHSSSRERRRRLARSYPPEVTGEKIDGFGELFRQLSYAEIGSATLQSRAFAGLANGTLVFGLPGSTGACRTGWEKIIRQQLDARNRPCNFAILLPRFSER